MFPRAGEKDNTAWISARKAAREAIDTWVRLVWVGRSYVTRPAEKGYAPDPDWSKLPPLNEMLTLALGADGIMRNKNHPIYRDLMGAPERKAADAGADLGVDDGNDDL